MHGAETLPWALPLGLGSSSSSSPCLFLVPPCWICVSVSSSFHFCYPFPLHLHANSTLISVPLSSIRIEQKIRFKENHMFFDDLFNSSCTTSIEWPPLFCASDSLLAFSMNLVFCYLSESCIRCVLSLSYSPLPSSPLLSSFYTLCPAVPFLSLKDLVIVHSLLSDPKWVLHILVINSCQCTCVSNLYTIDSVDHYLGQTHWGVTGKSVKDKKKNFQSNCPVNPTWVIAP